MELTPGCFKVQNILQSVIKPPYLVYGITSHSPKVFPNIFYTQYSKTLCHFFLIPSLPRILWWYTSCSITSLVFFSLFRIIYLFSRAKYEFDVEQIGYYLLLLAIAEIARSAYSTLDQHRDDLIYILNQQFLIMSLRSHLRAATGWRFLLNPVLIGDVVMFGFTASFFAFPLCFGGIPMFRAYDPIQITCKHFGIQDSKMILQLLKLTGLSSYTSLLIIEWSVKGLSSLWYIFISSYGATAVLLIMYASVVLLEAFIKMSNNIKGGSAVDANEIRLFARFRRSMKAFRVLQIMIEIAVTLSRDFFAVLVGMGVLAATLGGFVMLVMYNDLPLIMYISCSGIFVIAQIINFLLVSLAGIPNSNAKKFRRHWRGKLEPKSEAKRMLLSVPEVGFCIGFVRNVKYHTAFSIAETIINLTATVALMKVNAQKIQ